MATTPSTTTAVNQPAPVRRDTRLYRRATNSMRIILYQLHHRDKPIAESDALRNFEPNIAVRSSDVGPSGSILRREHTVDADDGKGKIPVIAWNPPANVHVDHYALVCEDIDSRIGAVTHHGMFYNIPSARWNANEGDIKRQAGESKPRLTHSAWNYVTTYSTDSYSPISPPRGHDSHRYVFTVLALSQRLTFDHPDKVTKMEFHRALSGKVVGWGQWIGKRDLRLPGQTQPDPPSHPTPITMESSLNKPSYKQCDCNVLVGKCPGSLNCLGTFCS